LSLINSKHQITKNKWFDKPFDHLDPSTRLRIINKLGIFNRLTVLSKVEGLTTLSPVEGQYPNSKFKNPPDPL
jgi:hypothetical protein